MRLRTEASDLVPEEVLVLETVGKVNDFIRAVERVQGMELLAEIDVEDIPPDDDFFATASDGKTRLDRSLQGRAFLVFTNKDALNLMMSFWETLQSKNRLPRNMTKWEDCLRQLHEIRRWGIQDRLLETGVRDDWRKRVEAGHEIVPCEIELWYRQDSARRQAARDRVVNLVEGMAGQVDVEADVPEIRYHALLVQLPVAQVGPVLEADISDIDLIRSETIQFFRASGQMSTSPTDGAQDQDREELSHRPPTGSPVIALFDGVPLQAHRRLQGRLVVDDPDGLEGDSPAVRRQHGTAMASVILHGDLAAGEEPLARPLYVRPILRAHEWVVDAEVVAERTLAVDLIHRAVRRLFEGNGGEPPIAPGVAVINLSIGIQDRPFDYTMSPLARLIDWLAWRYKVLFVVSAGNHKYIKLLRAGGPTSSLFEDSQENMIRSVAADARNRRLLSPAESVNALTVASTHEDASTELPPPGLHDPYTGVGLPSPLNAQGMGYRRGIKPDVLAAGGRVVLPHPLPAGAAVSVYTGPLPPGQRVASPGADSGDLGAVRYFRGTSNATALVSRACGLLYDTLDELRVEYQGEVIDAVPRAVWLKALVAHGAEWGEAGSVLTRTLKNDDNRRQFKEYITRLVGYGAIDIDRVRECTASRVTALGGGKLRRDESHILRFPLPPSLAGKLGHRLVITLAWFSPFNQRHHAWRRAALSFDPPRDPIQVRRQQADWQAVRRGTLQHEILEGKKAAAFVEGADLEIRVSCRAGAGSLEEEIPYALAVTLEVAEELGIDIYDEVRAAVHTVPVRPDVGA